VKGMGSAPYNLGRYWGPRDPLRSEWRETRVKKWGREEIRLGGHPRRSPNKGGSPLPEEEGREGWMGVKFIGLGVLPRQAVTTAALEEIRESGEEGGQAGITSHGPEEDLEEEENSSRSSKKGIDGTSEGGGGKKGR